MSEEKQRSVSFNHYLDKKVLITFSLNRSIVGVIKGWDSLNLIIDEAVETRSLPGKDGEPVEYTRSLGQILIRLANICSILPEDGYEPIVINAEPVEQE